MTGAWSVGDAPAVYPLTYPGPTPPADALLAGRSLWRVTRPAGVTELGDWTIKRGDRDKPQRLDDVLAEAGAAPVEQRKPMLAVGSNRSPGQLAHKMDGMPDRNRFVLMTEGRAKGIAIAHSAHIGVHGYLPYTAVARNGWYMHWIIWCDEQQQAVIDGTEGNYVVAAGTVPLSMWQDFHLEVKDWVMYRSKWGAFQFPRDLEPLVPGSQEAVWIRLHAVPWFRELFPPDMTPERTARLLAQSADLRVAVREAFRAHGCAVEDGLDGLVCPVLADVPARIAPYAKR